MQTLITPAKLKSRKLDDELFEIDDTAPQGGGDSLLEVYLQGFIDDASIRLREWVSDSVYETARAAAQGDTTQERLTKAELALCFIEAMPAIILKKATDIESTEVDGFKVKIRGLTKVEAEGIIAEMLRKAENAAKPYLLEYANDPVRTADSEVS